MAIEYDPNFRSGLEYALAVAGGENVPGMIAPGVSYSSEFPMGYMADGLAPTPMPVPMPQPTLEDFQRVDPFTALNAQLSDSLANPTSAMYSTDVGTGGSMGLGSPMMFDNFNIQLPSGGLGSYDPSNIVDPSSTLFGGSGGVIPEEFDPVTGEMTFRPQNAQDILNTGQFIGTQDQATGVANIMANLLNERAAGVAPEGGTTNPITGEFTQDAEGTTATMLNNIVRNAKASDRAADNAADNAAIAREKARAMATLYGGAGSSFESGRNEYTESGQYDIDREARQAEFDAMREQDRINAGLPPIRLTPEETQQAVQELQASIGFGGAMTPKGRNSIPTMEATPTPQPFKGYTPFDFANIQSILNNLG